MGGQLTLHSCLGRQHARAVGIDYTLIHLGETHVSAQYACVHILLSGIQACNLVLGCYPTRWFSAFRLRNVLTCQAVQRCRQLLLRLLCWKSVEVRPVLLYWFDLGTVTSGVWLLGFEPVYLRNLLLQAFVLLSIHELVTDDALRLLAFRDVLHALRIVHLARSLLGVGLHLKSRSALRDHDVLLHVGCNADTVLRTFLLCTQTFE